MQKSSLGGVDTFRLSLAKLTLVRIVKIWDPFIGRFAKSGPPPINNKIWVPPLEMISEGSPSKGSLRIED